MMIVMLIATVGAFGLVFFTCEIGQRFTTEFDTINGVIDQFKWYAFPFEVQRMLPVIITIAQQEVAVECFGSVMCLRESLKKVSVCWTSS